MRGLANPNHFLIIFEAGIHHQATNLFYIIRWYTSLQLHSLFNVEPKIELTNVEDTIESFFSTCIFGVRSYIHTQSCTTETLCLSKMSNQIRGHVERENFSLVQHKNLK